MFKDRNQDGVVSPMEVAQNMGEMVDATLRGRWEQNIFVPAVSAILLGGFTALLFLGVTKLINILFGVYVNPEAGVWLGLIISGLWGCWEIYSTRSKAYQDQYKTGFQNGEQSAIAQSTAKIRSLEMELDGLKSTKRTTSHLTPTDERQIEDLKFMIREIYIQGGTFPRQDAIGKWKWSRSRWEWTRNTLIGMGIIDENSRALLSSGALAYAKVEEREVRRQKIREQGGVPA